MAKLFGFSIDSNQNKSPSVISPVPETNQDGVDNYISSGFYGQYVDIEGVFRTEHDLIKRYREMALHPEADGAIEDVSTRQSLATYMILCGDRTFQSAS